RLRRHGAHGLFRQVEGDRGLDQAEMRERLREVPDQLAGVRVDLLGQQADVAAEPQQALEQLSRTLQLAGAREALHEPERADRERRLVSGKPVYAVGDVP